MTGHIVMRPVGEADRDFLFEVFRAVRSVQFQGLLIEPHQLAVLLEQQFAAQQTQFRQQFPGASYELITLDGMPAGYLYTFQDQESDRILDIALLPEYSGRQLGSRVVRELIEQAAGRNRPIKAHVEKMSPAARFWRRMGFQVVGDNGLFLEIEKLP